VRYTGVASRSWPAVRIDAEYVTQYAELYRMGTSRENIEKQLGGTIDKDGKLAQHFKNVFPPSLTGHAALEKLASMEMRAESIEHLLIPAR